MKTIKELSNSIGVSRVSLYSMIKREEFKSHVFKDENNTTLIDEVGEQLLKAYYSKEQGETLQDIVTETISYEGSCKADSKDNNELNSIDIIAILQAQLTEKDSQINTLLNIVSNGQKLQATQFLADKNIQPQPDAEPSGTVKKSFLAKVLHAFSL